LLCGVAQVIAVAPLREGSVSRRPSGKTPSIVGADSLEALHIERPIPSLSPSLQDVGRARRKQSFASGMQEVQTEVSEVVS
jgi:hypothetical protein